MAATLPYTLKITIEPVDAGTICEVAPHVKGQSYVNKGPDGIGRRSITMVRVGESGSSNNARIMSVIKSIALARSALDDMTSVVTALDALSP